MTRTLNGFARVWCTLICAAAVHLRASALAQTPVTISEQPAEGTFPLVDGITANVVCDDKDAKVVGFAARLFAGDIEQVTGVRPNVVTDTLAQQPSVIVGTIGASRPIDKLIADGKLDVAQVRGKWEAYTIAVVADPFPGVKQALVVAGADRRGTAYGVFTLSDAIGVSPWSWWADVRPTKKPALHVRLDTPRTDAPHVKYRGIFINDEDWGLQPWAANTFEKDVGGVGPKTYAKVFELLLRLKANYLWPAMHPCTKEFGEMPGNAQAADDWGIVMGSSHAEPMLRNNVHWGLEKRGPWRYDTNRQGVYAYWEEYAKNRGKFEAAWTVGMRGIHDSGMQGPRDTAAKVKLLGEAITDQRGLLARYVNPDVEKVPQVFMPYKEALGLYQAGLKVPDDVTLVWCEDNYGYLRQLSTPEEQKRSGGSGIYYHISYLGNPGTYLWVESTPLSLIWAEMDKARQYGADRLWVLNVGDIKNNEIGCDFWLTYAWQPDRFKADAQRVFLREWAAKTFGDAYADDVAAVLNDYFRLSFQRKPEHMKPGIFRVDAYGESQTRLISHRELDRRATALFERLPADKRDGYYELVLYKVRVAVRVAESFCYVDLNRQAAAQGRTAAAVEYGRLGGAAVDSIRKETAAYNESFLGGKWKHMIPFAGMALTTEYRGWATNVIIKWPEPAAARPTEGATKVGITIDGNDAVLLDGVTGPVDTGERDITLDLATATLPMPWTRTDDLVGVPNGVGDTLKAEDARGVTLDFDVPEAGTYNVFGRVVAPDNKDDSFFVRIDDRPWATWNDIPGTSEPAWRQQGRHTLSVGRHTITIANREDGALIGAVRLTTRDAAEPPDPRRAADRLPTFADTEGRRTALVRVFQTDGKLTAAEVTTVRPWIKIEPGEPVGSEPAFKVSVDFNAAPATETFQGEVRVTAGGKAVALAVNGIRLPADGTAGEIDGVVSIAASKFTRAAKGKAAEWFVVPGLGREGDAVTIRPATAPGFTEPTRIRADAPILEYDFVTGTAGPVRLSAYCLPTHRIHAGRGQRYAVAIDDAEPTIVDFAADGGESGEGGARWSEGRLRNTVVSVSRHALGQAGRHTLKLWMVDPGVIVDKLVLDLGGDRPSELGPPQTALSK